VSEPAIAASSLVSCERLEWGKACQTHDGPIVRLSEHRVLGRSPGFPRELEELCHPDRIGPVTGEEDFDPAAYPHGTVLRPVVHGDGIRPLLVRVRRRPEDGDGGTARLYYLARYLAAPSPGHDPMVLFTAMESLPLAGLTAGEAAALEPLLTVTEAPALGDGRPFLEKAVAYALSGVPMAITEPLPELTFFAWAAALWWLLPAPLRPLVSCGWGVAWQLTGELLLAHAGEAAPNAAVFSPGEGTWRDPAWSVLGRGDEEQRSPFDPRRLIPGRLCAHEVFGDPGGAPPLAWPAGASPALPALAPAAAVLPPLPDLRDPATVRTLRRPGLDRFDAHRLGEAELWIDSGETSAADPLTAFTAGLAFAGARRRAALAALAALAGGNGRRERAETLLWRLLSAEGTEEARAGIRAAIAGATGPGAARARLLAALAPVVEPTVGGAPVSGSVEPADEELLTVLERLQEAGAQAAGTVLPAAARELLVAALDRSLERLDPRLADSHARLLRLPQLPVDYERWLPGKSHALLFACGRSQPPDLGPALLRLGALAGSPTVDALGRWLLGQLPGDRDGEALAAAPAADRERLSRLLTERWERPGSRPAEVRERVLAWCRVHPPGESGDPLLRLARGGETTAAAAAEVAAEVERGAVPASLLDAIAVVVLDHWALLGDRLRRQAERWAPVIERLPRALSYLAFEAPAGRPLAECPEALRAAYGRFAPSVVEMRDLLARWLPRMPLQRIDNREAAAALWDWAIAASTRPALELDAIEVCRCLARGEWAAGETLAADEIEKVRRLATEAGKLADLAAHRAALWLGAARPWQLHLVLSLFPGDALDPAARQLELLRSDPGWLRRHLESPDLEPRRRDALRPALLGFHEVPYPGSHGIEWRDDFSSTVLWAVFAGTPFDRQGPLAPALESFAPAAAARARLALRYLDAHPEDRAEAARQVVAALVAPVLRQALAPVERQALVASLAGPHRPAPARGWLARLREWWAEGLARGRRFQVVDSPVGAPAACRAGDRRIALAPWLRELLARLLAALGEERLQSELTSA
jgi:hypothetical protein